MSPLRLRVLSAAEARELMTGNSSRLSDWLVRQLDAAASGRIDLQVIVADDVQHTIGVLVVEPHGHNWAALTIPEGELPSEALRALLDHVSTAVTAPLGLKLLCTVLDDTAHKDSEVFVNCGFHRISDVARYQLQIESFQLPDVTGLTSRLPHSPDEAEDIYHRTQGGSLDFPELASLVPFELTTSQTCRIYEDNSGFSCGITVHDAVRDASSRLAYFGVLPERRGHGFGRQILDSVAAEVADCGGQSLFLDVDVRNHFAVRLYESMGFHQEGIRSLYARRSV